MKHYPEYKESGVEWIGEIPKYWKIVRGKFILSHKKEINPDFQCNNLLSLTLNGVLRKDMNSAEGLIPSNYRTYQVFYPDNLVFKLIDLENIQTSRVGIVPEKGIMSPVYIRLEDDSDSYERYYFYQYYDLYKQHIFNFLGKGVRSSLSPSDLLEIPLAFPPPSEQRTIIDFLDRKTRQIDELIRIKERRIELLKEQRTALINQAVTKGLDPNVEMKPSGVEWIGETPAHWEIIRLRYLGVLQNGISKDSDSFGLGYPFLSYGDVYNNETLPTQVEGLVKSTKVDRERYSVQERDVFFTRTSETIKEIGISSACMKTIENCVFSGFLIRFRNTSTALTKEFSKYYFPSHLPRIFLAREVNIVTRSSLSQELLKRLPVLLPPPDEQKEITMFLDEQTQKIDSMIEKENKQIELLKEYRQSLISEAVTGKIDVRSEV